MTDTHRQARFAIALVAFKCYERLHDPPCNRRTFDHINWMLNHQYIGNGSCVHQPNARHRYLIRFCRGPRGYCGMRLHTLICANVS